jgi:DNA helicase II / ATP-dependent DNA helicase PcrA
MSATLDKYQKQAVVSEEQNLLVVAAPGSGKTTVIINKISYLVNRKGVNPDNIIVITFTKSAALSMKKRYESISSSGKLPFFGTFHALFYKILRRFSGEISILDSGDAHRIIKKVLLTYLDEINEDKIKEVLNLISLFKCGNIGIEEFKPSIDKNIFNECLQAYEGYKKEMGILDFDDLQIRCRRLFTERIDILEGYRRMFKYILVDEFQDCDGLQIELLQMLNEGNSLFAVGDEDQCIYSFRGSKPESMVHFGELFKNGKKVFLHYNYRSPENIVGISVELINNNSMRNRKDIKASRNICNKIEVCHNINESMQAEEIAYYIERMKTEEEFKYKSSAILYRTNVESRSIIDAFIRKRIPFRLLDREYNFFEHFICRDLLAYLSLSIDSTDRKSFSQIINKPFRYISKLNIERVMTHKYKESCFDTLASIDGLPVFQLKVLNDLKKDVHYLNKMSLRSAVDFLIMDIGYIDYLREYSIKFKLNINELEEVLEEFKAVCSEFMTISALLGHVEEVGKEIKKSKSKESDDCVTLSTIHGVKGMEFCNVFIINCVEDSIPHINSINNIEEERRLFYVGITRTIENLFICVPKTIRGKVKGISRFIKECGLKAEVDLSLTYKIGDKVIHEVFGIGDIVSLEGNEIDIRFENGVKRKFDILVLLNNKLLKNTV